MMMMNRFLKDVFTCEVTSGSHPAVAVFRYAFTAIIIALIVWTGLIQGWSDYKPFIVPLMLLFNQLAFHFNWPLPLRITFRIVALLWLIFGSVITYSDVMHSRSK